MSDQQEQDHRNALLGARFANRLMGPDYREATRLLGRPDSLRQHAKEKPGIWSERADECAKEAAVELAELRRLLSEAQYPDPRALAEAVAQYAHHCNKVTLFRTIHFFAAESESDDSES